MINSLEDHGRSCPQESVMYDELATKLQVATGYASCRFILLVYQYGSPA